MADRLPCPECGNPSVIAVTGCMVEVGTGFAGLVYGRPEVLTLIDDQEAKCNSSACRWTGTVGEVRAAAR